MYPGEEHTFDYSCPHCGQGYYAEIGFGKMRCDACGKSMQVKSAVPEDLPEDDVYFDDRYVSFDPIKAFRILRDLGLLELCQ